MIRSELVARVAAQNPHLYAKEVEEVVITILNTMIDALARGDRVELRDFGSFATREIMARLGRDPRTGATVAVAAKKHVAFRPGKAMRLRLNPGGSPGLALEVANGGGQGGGATAGLVGAQRRWVGDRPREHR